jgi:hypothetical protein
VSGESVTTGTPYMFVLEEHVTGTILARLEWSGDGDYKAYVPAGLERDPRLAVLLTGIMTAVQLDDLSVHDELRLLPAEAIIAQLPTPYYRVKPQDAPEFEVYAGNSGDEYLLGTPHFMPLVPYILYGRSGDDETVFCRTVDRQLLSLWSEDPRVEMIDLQDRCATRQATRAIRSYRLPPRF